jgi:hypothetical protein
LRNSSDTNQVCVHHSLLERDDVRFVCVFLFFIIIIILLLFRLVLGCLDSSSSFRLLERDYVRCLCLCVNLLISRHS